jgi:hypothetical protein
VSRPPGVKKPLRTRWSQVDLETQDALLDRSGRVAQHREVLEVEVGRLNEALSLRTFDRREAPAFHGIGPFTKPQHHLIGIKGRTHNAMIEASIGNCLGNMDSQLSTSELWSPPVMARGQ